MADDLEWRFHEQDDDTSSWVAIVDGRRLIVSFPRLEPMDYGQATWTAYWDDEHLAGVDRSFTGEVTYKHHLTTHDVEPVIKLAAAMAPRVLPR